MTRQAISTEKPANDIVFAHNIYENTHYHKDLKFIEKEFFTYVRIFRRHLKNGEYKEAGEIADLVGGLVISLKKRLEKGGSRL